MRCIDPMYYEIQASLSYHMNTDTDLMSAMCDIWPFIEAELGKRNTMLVELENGHEVLECTE